MSDTERQMLRDVVAQLEVAMNHLRRVRFTDVPNEVYADVLGARLEIAHAQGTLVGIEDVNAKWEAA